MGAETAREGRIFPCPHCRQRIFVLSEDRGKVARCPLCQKPFRIDETLRTLPLIEGRANRRRHERFTVRDGLVRLPWGPFKSIIEAAHLDDLSVGGLRCHYRGFEGNAATFEILRHVLRAQAEVDVELDLPAFTERIHLKGIVRRIKHNQAKKTLTLCIQFVRLTPDNLARLERLESNPIIRGIVRNLVS